MFDRGSLALFRDEAQRHALGAVPGIAVVRIPRLLNWSSRILPLVAVAAGLAISSVEYSRKEKVSGVLASSLGSSRITATVAGTVQDVMVSPGQRVAKDQVLAVMSPDLSRSGGNAIVLEQLGAAQQRKAEIAQQVESTTIQHELLLQRLSGSIAANQLERKALSEQIALQEEIAARLEKQANVALGLADKKLISARDAEQRQNALDDARTQTAALKRELARLDATILQARSDLEASGRELKLSLSRLNVQELEFDSQIAGLRGESSVQIVSPINGAIDYVAYRPGQVAVEGSLLFSVVPNGSSLRAELFVPSRAIARVKAGQPVRIEYDAFPAEFFGYAGAFLTSINETLLDPAEARIYGATTSTPVYRLFAALSSQTVTERGQKVGLRSGMTFTADILIEKHPLYVWMWRELTRAAKAL